MLKYNNNHIFTGYLKQLLSSVNLPACKIYTNEFANYLEKNGKEDPRVLKSFDKVAGGHPATRINYLKNDEVYNYFWKNSTAANSLKAAEAVWKKSADLFYSKDKFVPGLTKRLYSPGISYDTKTHEYLGDYLRFLRDYYNINLMSLYNCFTDKIYNNIYFSFTINPDAEKAEKVQALINAQESGYRLYALPVKLFAEYTIAIDCDQGIELFCGLYNTNLDMSAKAVNLAARTYQKVHKTMFNQPFLYNKLNIKHWSDDTDFTTSTEAGNDSVPVMRSNVFTRWDLTNREKDLKLFIKIPVSCKSSITILEGNYINFNDVKYAPVKYIENGQLFNPAVDDSNTPVKHTSWHYNTNHCVLNFDISRNGDNINLNKGSFRPISQIQLLAFNTGESYPFADRLIEYLGGSAITPIDEIPDNIKRVQKVMNQNDYWFEVDGLWENKMQKIIYDYIMNSGPIEVTKNGKLIDKHSGDNPINHGYHRRIGHVSKSGLYDILGYVDKNAEKWYANWGLDKVNNKPIVETSLQNVDIYNGLYDI